MRSSRPGRARSRPGSWCSRCRRRGRPPSGVAEEMAVPSEGMNASAMPAAAISEAGRTSTTNEPSGRTSARPAMPTARRTRPATIGAFGAEAGDDPRREHDHHHHDREGHRQQRCAALEGAEAEDLLQVEVEEVPHGDPRGAEQHLREVRGGEVRRAEDRQAHQRLADARPAWRRTARGTARPPARTASVEVEPQPYLGSADDREHGGRQAARWRGRRRARRREPSRRVPAGITRGVTSRTPRAIGTLT